MKMDKVRIPMDVNADADHGLRLRVSTALQVASCIRPPFCFRSILSRHPTPSDLSLDRLLPRTNSGALVQAFRRELGESLHGDRQNAVQTCWFAARSPFLQGD